MQNQKTMAKWLAIALLLMVAIACYVVLSTVLKKDNTVSDTTASASETAQSEQSVSLEPTVPEHIPVYSSFPRRAERVGASLVSHVGGENTDTYLASYSFQKKTLLLFSTLSTEYDVKEPGIHLAVFSGDYLLSTSKLADGNETYLSSILTKTGILVATKTDAQTVFRLLSIGGDVTATSFAMRFDSLALTLDSSTKEVVCLGSDESFLYEYTIDDNLNAIRSNFVYTAPAPTICEILNFRGYKLIFAQTEQGVEIVSFSPNTGFTRKNRLINSTFVQILPSATNSSQAFTLLTKRQDDNGESLLLVSFDASGNMLSSYLANGVSSGVLKQENEQLLLLTDSEKYQFCSHLELVSKTQYTADDSLFVARVRLENIDGTELSVRTDGISFQVMDKTANVLFSAKGKSVYAEYVLSSDTAQPTSLKLIYEGKSTDTVSYMAFGDYDVMIVEIGL
ncbi:MAG: hypothetical protein IJ226_03505 [Clostridia bacterium]|nr:hypothetical protein [Clostridia bacterium]